MDVVLATISLVLSLGVLIFVQRDKKKLQCQIEDSEIMRAKVAKFREDMRQTYLSEQKRMDSDTEGITEQTLADGTTYHVIED